MINAVQTLGNPIRKGEEFFASYGYPVLTTALEWYQEEFKRFSEEHPELAKHFVGGQADVGKERLQGMTTTASAANQQTK